MSIYKRGNVYWYKFMWNGESIRQSTSQGSDKKARDEEAKHRARLVEEKKEREKACERLGCSEVLRCHECERLFNAEKAIRRNTNVFCTPKCTGEWDKKHSMPTLREFLDAKFLPFVETRHKPKPLTIRYYTQGSGMLKKTRLADLRLEELTDKHAQEFAAHYSAISASGINRGLRTLRRALNLAYKWNVMDKLVKIELAAGENQRDRVLTDEELEAYLGACPQPWRDCATMIADEGFRPGEVFALRWSHVLFNNDGTGLIQIVDGKSKAARRILPMTPRVYDLLWARYESASHPEDGWIFPSASTNWTFKNGRTSKHEHFHGDSAKEQHKKALADSGVKVFVPYVLRHTALTRLGDAAGGDVFVLAKIAGHSSITVTQRYVHPQAEAIGRVFAKRRKSQSLVGTKLGTGKKPPKARLLSATLSSAVTNLKRKG